MKKKTYQFLVVTLSLVMILAASCGREGEKAVNDLPSSSASTTTTAVETPHISDVIISRVSVCGADSGKLTVIERDGTLISIPYDVETGTIALADGGTVSLEYLGHLGTQLTVYHRAGEPGVYGEIVKIETEDLESVFLHGIVCRAGETLLVHPEPWRVLDTAGVGPAECFEIPLLGVPLVTERSHEWIGDIGKVQVGDHVSIYHSERMESPNRPFEVYSVALCQNITEQRTVSQVSAGLNRILLGGTALSRSIFDAGKVLDASGKPVAFEEVSVGDLFEVQHGGEILTSAPSQFGHLHVVRRIKTAAQIEADRAAQDALDALTRKVVLRGTVREFGTSKLVWLGETAAPEEIQYHGCTRVRMYDVPITDAATGQALTWADLRDGDYVAVEGSGGIAETAPSQWDTIYSVTRLNRLCLEGTVSAVTPEGVTVAFEDGKSRTVSVKQYYVRSVRFDVSSLLVGDRVRLDVNAADEAEVYALHLIDREDAVHKEAVEVVTETFRVTKVGGMDVWMVRDLAYDATQIRFDETGVVVFDGDVAFDVKRVFYDTDGSIRPASQLRQGDLITVAYSGLATKFEPATFVTIHRITRVAE